MKGALVKVSPLPAQDDMHIQDEVKMKDLACFGKLANPARMIPLGSEARLVFSQTSYGFEHSRPNAGCSFF